MSILEKMRGGSESTLMQLVLAAVVVSFVLWYGQPKGNKGTVVATVNGHVIPDTDFMRQYGQYENMREYQLGRPLTEAEETELRDQLKQVLIRDEVLRQQAVAYGLEVSDDEVARAILGDRRFQNEQGLFDEELYKNALKRMRYSRADYEANLRDNLLRDKLRNLVFKAPTVTDAAVKQGFVDTETTLDIAYVRITPAQFYDQVDLGSEAVKTFLAENADRVKAAYDADFDRLYNVPEKVQLRMIRLEIEQDGVTPEQLTARLNDLKQQIAGGADMAQLAARWSEDPSAAQGGLLDETPIAALDGGVVDAVAKLDKGAMSDVVADPGQVRLYRLEDRVPAKVIPLEEVQNDIATRLMREQEAPNLAATFAEKLLAAWKDAKEAPVDLLQQHGLQVQQTGPVPLGQPPSRLGPPPDMTKDAAGLQAGEVLPKVYEANGTYWVGELDVRGEPDMAKFEEQKALREEVVLLQERTAFFEAWVDQVVKSAKVE